MSDPIDAVALRVHAGSLLARLRTLGDGDAAVAQLCADLLALDEQVRAARARERGRVQPGLAAVDAALQRLSSIGTTRGLLERVCPELIRSGTFARVIFSHVEDGRWIPSVFTFAHERAAERELADDLRGARFEVDGPYEERRLVESTQPLVVTGGDGALNRHLASYVAAALRVEGRVVALIHADHGARPVTRVDRDVLWAYVGGLTRVFERVAIQERLAAQRRHVHETLTTLEALMEELAGAEVELARNASERSNGGSRAPDGAVQTLRGEELTARELEVLSLMVRGLSNAAIGERLVIAPGTVKSHVKHILRKLGAVNRSEAISLYLRGGVSDG